MKPAARNPERHTDSEPFTPATVRGRIARISSAWSPEERELRAIEGQLRRQRLLAAIGLMTRKVCA